MIREDLTEEEMKKWSTPSFLNYLSKRSHIPKRPAVGVTKGVNKTTGLSSANAKDAKTEIKRKVMASRANKAPEKGIKIMVGGPEIKV
jgi:hypothetical protein